MHGHHKHRGGRGHKPHEHGGWFEDIRERKASHRRERLFEQGDLKLVVLDLLQTRPRHGYEIIKAVEELAGGDYTPSPGVVYPTLTLLEEIGHATVTQETGGKKQYGITPEGIAFLAGQRESLERIRSRVESAGSVSDARRAPELQRCMQNFKTALHFRLSRGPLNTAALRKITEAIDRAAIDIERS
jgi:DNA-binding PadR family transcriptional regulator